MKIFNPNATKLIVSFAEKCDNEEIEWTIEEIPTANMEADNAPESENSNEVSFTPHEDADTYRVVLYVNMNEGNISLYNDDKEEEIETFSIKEIFEEDND